MLDPHRRRRNKQGRSMDYISRQSPRSSSPVSGVQRSLLQALVLWGAATGISGPQHDTLTQLDSGSSVAKELTLWQTS